MTRDWTVGDYVYVSGAQRFGGSYFLTNTRDMISTHAEFIPNP